MNDRSTGGNLFEAAPFVRAAGSLWKEATTAAFLEAIAAGSLPGAAFERWLVQDYHFARGLLAFQALALARAPRHCHEALVGGLAALDQELRWFESQATRRGLDLKQPLHPTCRRYTDFLVRRGYTETAPALMAILYGVEVSYLAAWSALEPEGAYAEFIERWSNPHFREYVGVLRRLAEMEICPASQPLFNEVLRHEREFWRMTWDD